MVRHHFYAAARATDLELGLCKGGETGNPYRRLKQYGTFAHRNDKVRFVILIACDIEEIQIPGLEHAWISSFEYVEEVYDDEANLNRAATVEGFRFHNQEELETKFREAAASFGHPVQNIVVYKTDQEISDVLRKFRALQESHRSPRTNEERIFLLNQFQTPHVEILRNMFLSKALEAAMVVAVCGYGKTVVTCKSLRDIVQRCFICVPTDHLKSSWKEALLKHSGFTREEIVEVGGRGESNPEAIQAILQKPRFVLLLCYASSHLLHDSINQRIQLGIFDEAHRLTGIAEQIEDDEEQTAEEKKRDIGRTKRLIRRCKDLHIQRLSLTFTPKGFYQEEVTNDIVNSNDDVELFGEPIIKVSLREMIDRKFLPPYQILFPQVEHNFTGLKARVQLMIHEFMRQQNNTYRMNKLVVFGASHASCRDIVKYLQELLPENHGVNIVYLNNAASVKSGIQSFTEAPRSILVNCLLLGEGVDIPIADSVCILCKKKSYVQIIQMLLRPGRYFPGKEMFYMILCLNDEDDCDFLSFVLDAVSQIDPHLDTQLLRRALLTEKGEPEPDEQTDITEEMLRDIIQSEEAHWYEIPKVRRLLQKIIYRRSGPLTRLNFDRIRAMCRRATILNTSGYNAIRDTFGWPEQPWTSKTMSAYEFFHGSEEERMSQSSFKELLQRNLILSANDYAQWQLLHQEYPSLEDINDGYFGTNTTNFQVFLPSAERRR